MERIRLVFWYLNIGRKRVRVTLFNQKTLCEDFERQEDGDNSYPRISNQRLSGRFFVCSSILTFFILTSQIFSGDQVDCITRTLIYVPFHILTLN